MSFIVFEVSISRPEPITDEGVEGLRDQLLDAAAELMPEAMVMVACTLLRS
jgi:hypothetical protein